MPTIGNSAGGGVLPGNNLFLGGSGSAITSGTDNIALGQNAASALESASNNITIGFDSAKVLVAGDANVLIGPESGALLNGAGNNIGIGAGSLTAVVTGGSNIAIGVNSGSNYVTNESSNILISNTGTAADGNTIRIGSQGSGSGEQDTCFIAGINGVTVASPSMVTIDASGQLGSQAIPSGSTPWIDIPSATLTAALDTGYVHFTFPTAVTVTLPPIAPFGSIVAVVSGNNAATLTVEGSPGQDLQGPGEGLVAYNNFVSQGYCSATFLCTEANVNWQMINSTGSWIGNV